MLSLSAQPTLPQILIYMLLEIIDLCPPSHILFSLLYERNHCAYVIEKTVTFTLQDGAAPYVKAEYNKCSRGQKCPSLL